MINAAQRRRPVMASDPTDLIAVPIVLRGEVIGAIEVETDEQSPDEDMVELVQSVSQRLAISLDNARLFEEAQESTAQEQRINSIVGQFQSAPTVDDLLQITLRELNEALGAKGGSIRLGKLAQTSENGHNQDGEHV
jgi:GAF domain-containing protein